MAEPPHSISLGDWLSIILGAMVSGISAAMAWFRGEKKNIHQRIDRLEVSMAEKIKDVESLTGGHNTQLAVLETNMANHIRTLDVIQETTRDTNKEVHALRDSLTDILLAIKRKE